MRWSTLIKCLPLRKSTCSLLQRRAPASVSCRFMSQRTPEDDVMKSIASWQIPNPYVSLQNWIFGMMVRGYYQQNFNLKEFLDACPHVLLSVVELLNNRNFEKVYDLMSQRCADKTIENWNKLNPAQQRTISNLSPDELFFKHPKIRMRMPESKSNDGEITSFLNIRMMLMYRVDRRLWSEYFPKDIDLGDVSNKLLGEYQDSVKHVFLMICAQTFELEREVTKGTDGFWEIKDMGTFPIPTPLFRHYSKEN